MVSACEVGYCSIARCMKRVLNSTIIDNTEVCFIRMQCVIGGLICIFTTI